MKTIKKNFILPSAAAGLASKDVKGYMIIDKTPEIGDIIYGKVISIGQHGTIENNYGRIHTIYDNTRSLFVFGNRYAPDYYEGFVPTSCLQNVDLLARSGMIGVVDTKKSTIKDPTRVQVLGYACDKQERILNTRQFPTFVLPALKEKNFPRAKMILSIGTSMNSGKSVTAASMCWALASAGHRVIASKITGTASLKDILLMNDAGADVYNDFTSFGYPSTYMLSIEELLYIFNSIDLKYCNNKNTYWVVEIADGIGQRETAMLLHHPDIRNRIHRLIFSAHDAFGAIGGMQVLENTFGLLPDAISGVCSSAPLHVRELKKHVNVPVFNSAATSIKEIMSIINEE